MDCDKCCDQLLTFGPFNEQKLQFRKGLKRRWNVKRWRSDGRGMRSRHRGPASGRPVKVVGTPSDSNRSVDCWFGYHVYWSYQHARLLSRAHHCAHSFPDDTKMYQKERGYHVACHRAHTIGDAKHLCRSPDQRPICLVNNVPSWKETAGYVLSNGRCNQHHQLQNTLDWKI